jgi:hypothetical protein
MQTDKTEHTEFEAALAAIEIATPSKKVFGEQVVNRWVRSLETKGYGPLAARALVDMLALRELLKARCGFSNN